MLLALLFPFKTGSPGAYAGTARHKAWQRRMADDGETDRESWLLRTSKGIRHWDLYVWWRPASHFDVRGGGPDSGGRNRQRRNRPARRLPRPARDAHCKRACLLRIGRRPITARCSESHSRSPLFDDGDSLGEPRNRVKVNAPGGKRRCSKRLPSQTRACCLHWLAIAATGGGSGSDFDHLVAALAPGLVPSDARQVVALRAPVAGDNAPGSGMPAMSAL